MGDHAAAEKAIGWKPEIDMREGIRRLLKWREDTLAAENAKGGKK